MSRGILLAGPEQRIRNLISVSNLIDAQAWQGGPGGQLYNGWTTTVGGAGVIGRVASSTSRNGYVYQFIAQAASPSVYTYCGTTQTVATPVRATPGNKYTAIVRMRQTTGATLQPLYANIVPRDSVGNGLQNIGGGTFTTPRALGEWVILRTTGVVPAGTVSIQLQARANAWNTGDTFEVDQAMITEGTYTGDICDGNTPGWSWTGAANASVASGPLYTAERASGGLKPVLSLGSTPASGSTTYPFVLPTSSFTVYSVQKDTAYVGSDGFWQMNNPTQRTARLLSSATGGGGSVQAAWANAGTVGNAALLSPSAINVPHIYTARLNNALAQMVANLDGGANANGAVATPPNDAISDRIYVGSRDNTTFSIVTDALYVYPTVHTDAQMLAISRFLGNRHGIVTA